MDTNILLTIPYILNYIKEYDVKLIIIFGILYLVYSLLFNNTYITGFRNKMFYKSYKYDITIEGEICYTTNNIFRFQKEFQAIMYSLINEYNVKKYKIYNNPQVLVLGKTPNDDKRENALGYSSIIENISELDNLIIEGINVVIKKHMIDKDKKQSYFPDYIISIRLYSNKSNVVDFIQDKMMKYEKFTSNINNDKIYNFTYHDINYFSQSLIKDYLFDKNNNLSFEHIFSENKDFLINEINKLKDIQYYNKIGIKRKKGYLFYGDYGTGKTSSILAMALYDKRHIIEVPFNRIKTNADLEEILNINMINSVKFKHENIIIVFDEIDRLFNFENDVKDNDEKDSKPIIGNVILDNLKDTHTKYSEFQYNDKKTKDKIKKSDNDDKLSLGYFLTKLDGLNNYEGLIIIATTNNIDKIEPAIYRDLRLTKIKFDLLRRIDIVNMIEKYFDKILSEEKISQIPDMKLSGANVKLLIDKYYNDFDLFFERLINK
jgi:ATPase family associated with various cellular activities (AAA)